jgi:hypothetical protein
MQIPDVRFLEANLFSNYRLRSTKNACVIDRHASYRETDGQTGAATPFAIGVCLVFSVTSAMVVPGAMCCLLTSLRYCRSSGETARPTFRRQRCAVRSIMGPLRVLPCRFGGAPDSKSRALRCCCGVDGCARLLSMLKRGSYVWLPNRVQYHIFDVK